MLVTAGPTYEPIDPVRFIGNHSSGKMGFAIAQELANCGAEVILIAGPVALPSPQGNVTRINVSTAHEMYEKAVRVFPDCDAAIMCAAVADFTPKTKSLDKIKHSSEPLLVELVPNKDIAQSLGKIKKEHQRLVGFALETKDETMNAISKIKKKNLDFIVLNSLNDQGAGFQYDTNKISIIDKCGKETKFNLKSKKDVAIDIINTLALIL